jgi:hypothetical protein
VEVQMPSEAVAKYLIELRQKYSAIFRGDIVVPDDWMLREWYNRAVGDILVLLTLVKRWFFDFNTYGRSDGGENNMVTIFKLRLMSIGPDAVEIRLFTGPDPDHLQLAGTLRLRVGEWQLLGTALLFGERHVMGHLKTIIEGERKALDAADRTEAEHAQGEK